jgi:hypothetical protein
MEDPTLEEDDEYVDEIIAELRRTKAKLSAKFLAMSREEYAEYCRRSREELRRRGVIVVDSEDHPMHPRNIERRWAEQGIPHRLTFGLHERCKTKRAGESPHRPVVRFN